MQHAAALHAVAPFVDAPPSTRSVLFTDVVASTRLIDTHGERVWLAHVDQHADRVATVARRHAGDVSSFLGDGFMVVFDDPVDAISAGIELQLESTHEGLLGIRVGIDHGDVHTFRDGWWVGRTIHLSSRITDLCERGQVAVSDRCREPVRKRLALPRSRPRLVAIRGLDEPCLVHVFG